MKIIFPHIPKCAGSSVKKQLAGRADVVFDYHLHPTWVSQQDILIGRQKRNEVLSQLKSKQQWVVFGHFGPREYYSLDYDLVLVILRKPYLRAISHYHYFKKGLPDNEVTRRRNMEVGPIKDGRMSIADFIKLDRIRFFYSDCYLSGLALDDRLVVLPMEDLGSTYHTIHELTGISLESEIWENKNDYRKDGNANYESYFTEDDELYSFLINRTRNRLGRL